jgi:hypothetical protein
VDGKLRNVSISVRFKRSFVIFVETCFFEFLFGGILVPIRAN